MNFDPDTFMRALSIWAIPVLLAITLHEVAHGWVASLRGDQSAKMLGRLTLNPLAHIDPVGTILIPMLLLITSPGFLFGWAKPVPVNPQGLYKPRRDMALVALAGPAANLIMALIWAAFGLISFKFLSHTSNLHDWLSASALAGIKINCLLAVLNLLPLPPLDGGRIVSSLIPLKWSYYYDQIEPFGFFILVGLLMTGILSMIISPYYFGLVDFFIDLVNTMAS